MTATLTQVVAASKRLVAATAVAVLAAGAVLVAGAPAAAAASTVDCSTANLQTAIDNAAPGATLIVTGTCPGSFTIDKNLTLLGQGTAVLAGGATGVVSTSPGTRVTLAGLKITGGNGFGSEGGGGITNEGTLTLRSSVVSGNFAAFGGGIATTGSSSLTLQQTTVSGNDADGEGGGGIYVEFGSHATVADSTVSDNVAQAPHGGFGGGIENAGTLRLTDTGVTGNIGVLGGGIANRDGSTTLADSTVSGNDAEGEGGGIYNLVGGVEGNTTLNDSTVSRNTAGFQGGGIENFGTVRLNSTPVASNVPDNCSPTDSVGGCAG